MAKKQTRRSISVSGDTYNAVRDYCDEHGLSASGLVTDLLEQYLRDNKDGPPPDAPVAHEETPAEQKAEPAAAESPRQARTAPPVRVGAPPELLGSKFPDRRGPGFTAIKDLSSLPRWVVTARIEISRRRQIDAETSVEVLLNNLVHRRMVNVADVVRVEQDEED
jgi:hypothetical protein